MEHDDEDNNNAVTQEMYEDYDYDDAEDDEYEDEEDTKQTIREVGMHKKMERIQKVLRETLQRDNERVSLDLREKEEGLRRYKAQREEIGVSLYGSQQQLAKLQLQLENTYNKYNAVNEERFQAEESADEMRETYEKNVRQLQDDKAQLRSNQTELDSLNATLKQVAAYNLEIKSEIEVARRATYKTEENISNLEKGKEKQDLYIDNLNEEIKSLKEQISISSHQIESQVSETKSAEETLREAAKEMENISFEKKQLLQQWKSSLIGMQRRDEALQATYDAIGEINETEISTRSEIQGYKQSIAKEQALNETLTAAADRIDAEITYCQEQLGIMLQEKERLSERYSMLQKSMQQTDLQTERVSLETKNIESDVSQVNQNLENVRRERHKLELEINSERNDQTTVHKAAHNLTKEATKLQSSIHEKEVAMAGMKNELARVKVDALNTSAHNVQLRETLQKLVDELKDKDTQVEKIQLEIRQRNDEIEKKMLRVDRLNKKYEQLTSKMEDVNTGPLEATIKHIKKETQSTQQQNKEKQRMWLNSQTGLVTVSAETEGINETNQEIRSNISILEQKRLRLLKNIEQMKKEIKNLKASVNGMHKDMVKLNELIAKNANLQEKLSNSNYGMEQEFVEELKELESESVKMDHRLDVIKNEKQQLLDQIIEIERQAMLWEKKIQLEKETQAALDPEVGQQEARNMEREIHRMRIRYESLKREQEKCIQEMELALHKRDAIAVRGRGQKGSENTAVSMLKKVSSLQNSLRKTNRDSSKYEIAIKDKGDKLESITFELERKTSDLNQQEERVEQTQKEINNALYDKQRYAEAISRTQRLAKRYENLLSGKISEIDPTDTDKVYKDHQVTQENLRTVRDITAELQKKHGHLNEVLNRVVLLAEDL